MEEFNETSPRILKKTVVISLNRENELLQHEKEAYEILPQD